MIEYPAHLIGHKRFNPHARLLGRMGHMETRLARTQTEVRRAQEIRYQVFYEELQANASQRARLTKRDEDRFDNFCDHLLVVERVHGTEKIIGTYRLLQDRNARLCGGFYSQSEFNISAFLNKHANKRFLELGRSCILKEHRSKRTLELMWQGLWAYVLDRKIDVLFGCASFQGTDIEAHRASLSWLVEHAKLAAEEDCCSLTSDGIDLEKLSVETNGSRRALAGLPPLLKGYLRVGAKVGSHAVLDHQFGTTDVLVTLKVADIAPRYLAHYGKDASRFAA